MLVDRIEKSKGNNHIGMTSRPTYAQASHAAPIKLKQIGSREAFQPQGLHQQ